MADSQEPAILLEYLKKRQKATVIKVEWGGISAIVSSGFGKLAEPVGIGAAIARVEGQRAYKVGQICRQ